MTSGDRKKLAQGGESLRRYVALWVGSIVFSFLLLVAGGIVAQAKLREMRGRIEEDEQALSEAGSLETTLLVERREDLLWRATNEAAHREAMLAALHRAVAISERLETEGLSPGEARLAEDMRAKLRDLYDATVAEPPASLVQVTPKAAALLLAVERYRDRNRSDLAATTSVVARVQATLNGATAAVIVFATLVLAFGSLGLVRRVVRPTLELMRTARQFGTGDFSARARVLRDDELGALCRTFNAMAEDAADHERARLDFVALVAHDLKNPLVTIGGGIRRLQNPALPPEQHAAWRHRIAQEAARLEKLTHDLMDTVQVSTGRLSLNKVELDLTALLRELVAEQTEVVSDHKLTFQGEEECRMLADRDRVERVAINLISNAAKYSPRGTAIEVKVARTQFAAAVAVRDEGAGIAPEEMAAIFQPFGRAAHAHRWAKGTGLGLNVVKQIIEAHGGSLNVQSKVGEGTTIEILLPLAHRREGDDSGV